MKKLLLITLLINSVSGLTQDTIIENVPAIKEFEKVEVPPVVALDSVFRWGWGMEPTPYIDLTNFIWTVTLVESLYNKKGATRDIKANKMKVLFPVKDDLELNSTQDKAFQKKYQLEFFRQQRERITHLESQKAYNQTIFAFLDEKYGQEWRFEMRNDAIGFEIPDSLFRKKADEIMTLLPEINMNDYVKRLPLKKPLFSSPLIPALCIPAILLSLVTIFFIFRRKKKSK